MSQQGERDFEPTTTYAIVFFANRIEQVFNVFLAYVTFEIIAGCQFTMIECRIICRNVVCCRFLVLLQSWNGCQFVVNEKIDLRGFSFKDCGSYIEYRASTCLNASTSQLFCHIDFPITAGERKLECQVFRLVSVYGLIEDSPPLTFCSSVFSIDDTRIILFVLSINVIGIIIKNKASASRDEGGCCKKIGNDISVYTESKKRILF